MSTKTKLVWRGLAGACASLLVLGACSSGSSHSTTTTTAADRAAIGTVADTAWHRAAQGTFRRGSWSVSYARTSTGWMCYDAQGAARVRATANAPTHQGRATLCLPPKAGAGAASFTPLLAGAESDQYVVVGAVTGGVKSVALVFANRTTAALDIDPHSRLVVWKGPVRLRPERIRAGAVTCVLEAAARKADETLCSA